MVNYALLIFDWNDQTRNIIGKCDEMPSVVKNLCRIAGINHHGAVACSQKDVVVRGAKLGTFHGFHYDASIVDLRVPAGHLACAVKMDAIGLDSWDRNYNGKTMASVMDQFAKAADDEERSWYKTGAFVPVYLNETPCPEVIEVHKTKFRHKDDPRTPWVDHLRTTYTAMVNV